MRGVPEQQREERDEIEAEPHHDAEAPEQREDVGHRAGGGLGDGGVIGLARIVDIALEQERIAEIIGVVAQRRPRTGIVAVGLQRFERVVGDETLANPRHSVGDQFVDSRDRLGEGARSDDAEHPGNADGVVDLAVRRIGNADKIETRRGRLGLPHALDGGELHLLVFRNRVTAFIAEDHHAQRGGEPERGGDDDRALGEGHKTAGQQVIGRDRDDEHRADHITGADRVDEFRLRHRIEDQIPERGQLHAHGVRIEHGADRMLHPAVGDQNPQRGKIRAERHQPGHGEVAELRQDDPSRRRTGRRRSIPERTPSGPRWRAARRKYRRHNASNTPSWCRTETPW